MKTALVTGSAGFIGFHLCQRLLAEGLQVVGVDNLSDYYDPALKRRREEILVRSAGFTAHRGSIETPALLRDLFEAHRPDIVLHLAAQAGVRYSIENPRSYVESNLCGTFELLEAARAFPPSHLLLASTSSAYGANEDMPFVETARADHPMSFYAATKRASEEMAHSYAHLYDLPVTMFRFFTVYGPWGRPDMALFKFTKAILKGEPVELYNNGDMRRDFTFVADLVEAVRLLIDVVPQRPPGGKVPEGDSLSPVAPFRLVNIGNNAPVQLMDFVAALEAALGRKAIRRLLPMQPGDVPATWADTSLLQSLTGYVPQTDIASGVAAFVEWYRGYYAPGQS